MLGGGHSASAHSLGASRATAPAASFPDTPAGRQARWLARAVTHLPLSTAQLSAHFDSTFIDALPQPATASLNGSFAGLRDLRVDAITLDTPTTLIFEVTVNSQTRLSVTLVVDGQGLIAGLHLQPAAASPPAAQPAASAAAPNGVRQVALSVGSPPLKGTLTLPPGRGPFPAVVLVSGSGPNDEDETVGANKPFLDIALGLADRGIASLRYDKRTLDYPQSVDPRTFTPTEEYLPDALAAIRLLEQEPTVDPRRIFLLGHSLGGTYAPLIAEHAPKLAGVIFLAAATESLGQALARQVRYLATLPGAVGKAARAELPDVEREAAQIDDVSSLERDNPGTALIGGVGPAYYLSELRYNEVATARALPQPLLFLQGDRDYQVTVTNDLDVWLRGLQGRKAVTVEQFPKADHLFLNGSGRPTPLDYTKAGEVAPAVIAAIANWIARIDRR